MEHRTTEPGRHYCNDFNACSSRWDVLRANTLTRVKDKLIGPECLPLLSLHVEKSPEDTDGLILDSGLSCSWPQGPSAAPLPPRGLRNTEFAPRAPGCRKQRSVAPLLSFAAIRGADGAGSRAPADKRNDTVHAWPWKAAATRGVRPSSSTKLIVDGALVKRTSTTWVAPMSAAK